MIRKDTQRRVDKVFAEKFLNDIRKQRITIGKDKVNKPVSDARITEALRRHDGIHKIKYDIIRADLRDRRKLK